MAPLLTCSGLALTTVLATGLTAPDENTRLADYFGFGELEIVRVDRGAGPMSVADIDGDGFLDLIVVNNHASRIEVHYQRPDASPANQVTTISRANELPQHWRFRRELLSVSHRVLAVVPHDFDGDGRLDLIYAGLPGEIVFMRQSSDGQFSVARKHRVRDLGANRNGLAVADVHGDGRPELLALVGGQIHIWTLDGDEMESPTKLAAGADVVAFMLADYTGDGQLDIAAVLPEDPAPIRMWIGDRDGGVGVLGAQLRFEMPAIVELHPVTPYGQKAAIIAVIERASKRLVLYRIEEASIEQSGNRDAAMEVYSFTDPGNRNRTVRTVDLNGDGLLDLIATDTQANALVAYHQVKGKGLQPPQSFPCYAEVTYLAAGNVDDDPYAELFVLSEKEGVVGRCDVSPQGIPYPVPLRLPDGFTPVALNLVTLDGKPHVAIVVKAKREYVLTLLDMNGERTSIELGSLSRSPETILDLDADQDGRMDLLLFTRGKPMKMLHAEDDGFNLIESDEMGQFGLVKAAAANNTAILDVDGDGRPELLIADRNYVRAVRYESDPPAGVSPGWQVVEQINVDDSTSKLVSLTVLGDRIVVADKSNGRLIILARGAGHPSGLGTAWRESESINVQGFSFGAVDAGALSGDGNENILAVGNDGFGIIRLAGRGWTLVEVASWRTEEEHRRQHELASGDINGDGFMDIVSLDAGEQMCEIFTLSEAGRLLYVTGFEVFESKIFSGGDSREYQPSQAIIADVTGDGASDLILLAHDRMLIYPQDSGQKSAFSGR